MSEYGPNMSEYGPNMSEYVRIWSEYDPNMSEYVQILSEYGPNISEYGPNMSEYDSIFKKSEKMPEMASERSSEGLDTVNRLEISIRIQWRWSRTPKSVFFCLGGGGYIKTPDRPPPGGNYVNRVSF